MNKKSTLAFAIGCLVLAGCNTMPEKPAFEPSKSFDGTYRGTRTDVSNDFICKPTSITGTVANGEARFKLTYNNTNLKGWIDQAGQLTLYDDNSQWNYHFSGTATATAIEGKWSVDGAPCRGTWRVERQ
ncbi:MAG: hypothetical protein KDI82_02650 [Gammaproteobacteria bacterium]|nr:hypothetical protein [Gammaproteobacteria bacterium]